MKIAEKLHVILLTDEGTNGRTGRGENISSFVEVTESEHLIFIIEFSLPCKRNQTECIQSR